MDPKAVPHDVPEEGPAISASPDAGATYHVAADAPALCNRLIVRIRINLFTKRPPSLRDAQPGVGNCQPTAPGNDAWHSTWTSIDTKSLSGVRSRNVRTPYQWQTAVSYPTFYGSKSYAKWKAPCDVSHRFFTLNMLWRTAPDSQEPLARAERQESAADRQTLVIKPRTGNRPG